MAEQPDDQEKKVAMMAVRLPLLIFLAVALMFAMAVLAYWMH